MVPAEQLRGEIDDRLGAGQNLIDKPGESDEELKERRQDYYTWTEYNEALLRRSFDTAEPADQYAGRGAAFVAVGGVPDPLPVKWRELRNDMGGKMRRLRSIQERLPLYQVHPDATAILPAAGDSQVQGDDVFIVHGHDGETKVMVARFLAELLGRQPLILHEQPDRERTIIEKFEDHAAQAACAIVLLTGDDEGGPVGGTGRPRARQNVVLELGYFLGRLGRDRVVILYEPNVELPSDINGVLYVKLDDQGAWRNSVARELEAVGLAVDLYALLR
jgi:predicted nucleotide-binding protein